MEELFCMTEGNIVCRPQICDENNKFLPLAA
jgi:hypothetical protein